MSKPINVDTILGCDTYYLASDLFEKGSISYKFEYNGMSYRLVCSLEDSDMYTALHTTYDDFYYASLGDGIEDVANTYVVFVDCLKNLFDQEGKYETFYTEL